MNKTNLENLSKAELIQIILSLKEDQPRKYKPRPPKPNSQA